MFLAATLVAGPRTTGAQPEGIDKGRTQLGAYLAVGRTLSPQGSPGHRPSLELVAHWGKVVSGPRGPGILEGNLEIGLDVVPAFVVLKGETTYGFHVAVCFRHYLNPGSRIRPFVALRSGPLVTNREIPENTSRFNFASEASLGFVIPATERLFYTFEVGLQHVSNADTSPDNPGVSSVSVRAGMSFFR